MKVLGAGDVEIEGAGYLEVDPNRAGEARDGSREIGPEEGTQCFSPALRLTENIAEAALFSGGVAPSRSFDANLAIQEHGLNRLHCLNRLRLRRAGNFEVQRD